MSLRVVGLDLSLAATGMADEDGTVTITSKARGVERLALIWSSVADLVDGVDLVVMEDYAYRAGDSHAHELGELGGVVRLGLWTMGVPFATIVPSSLKRYATGKGNANKEAVLAAAIRRLDYEGHDHNQADALWLRAMALDAYRDERAVPMPADQRAALAKVTWPVLGKAWVA